MTLYYYWIRGLLPIENCTVPYADVKTGSDATVTTGLEYARAKAMMRNVLFAPHTDRWTRRKVI